MMNTPHSTGPGDRSKPFSPGATTAARLAVVAAAVFQVATPILPSLGIGRQVGQQSSSVQALITPAGWTFSIWLLLYAGSLAYAVYQALPAQRGSHALSKVRWASAGAFIGNGLWALYTQLADLTFVSILIIAGSLTCLLYIYGHLAAERVLTRGERYVAALPLSALAAWLTAATIVNVAATLNYYGVDPSTDKATISGAIVLIGGVIAAAAIWRGKGNPWFALVFLWALLGIYGRNGHIPAIAATCAVSAFVVVAVTVFALRREGARRLWLGDAASHAVSVGRAG
ncbi:hypothetical protein [uncultured Sphingomonas sp.]|uniref:hypothetical protein n=1 Tax=uncultured Sphingomonas sp. TaxID=158754 RepID=UPI00374915A9